MTLRYLNQAASVALVSGTGKVSLTPPSGQFWIPRLIRVGTNTAAALPFPNQQPELTASLFHGGFQDTGVDAFVDGTGNGLGDVSALMNGTLIQTTEYLTAKWLPLDIVNPVYPAGTTGYLQIVGLSADTIAEATDVLASAAPGPGFKIPLPSAMNMPPAAHSSSEFIFNTPGQNNTVNLMNANTGNYLYIYNVSILTGAFIANVDGNLEAQGAVGGDLFAYYNPGASELHTNVVWNFHGMRMNPNGLQWRQNGSAAANAATYSVNVSTRFMPY